MREVVRLLNKQKLKEASEQYERSKAVSGGLRYLTTFGFSNFGQGSLRQKRMDAFEEEDPRSNTVEQKRSRVADDDQELKYLAGFGFSSFGLKRTKMIDANRQGLSYLIGFGFSNIGQKRMGSRAGNEKMKQKYLTGFGFSNFGHKRGSPKKEEEELDPRIGCLMGFGFGFGRMRRGEKRLYASADSKDKVNQ